MDDFSLNIYKQGKVKLDILLCNYCNLNCSACMFGTNTKELPRLVYDLEQYKKDMTHLAQFKDIMCELHFLGGEPTLNKDLLSYIQIARELFPDTKLNLITNGIKLVKDLKTLNALKELEVHLIISQYPETAVITKNLSQTLNMLGANYTYLVSPHSPILKNVWSAPLTATIPINTNDLKDLKFKCKYGCTLIWNGRINACAIQFSIPMRNKLFKTNYKEEKGPLIRSIKTAKELIELQANSYIPEICKYCQPGSNNIKWIPHTLNKINKSHYIL